MSDFILDINLYNYYRDYDPSLGRYIQSDPVGLQGGLNTFSYVGGNPLSFIDLFGLTQSDIATALAIAKDMKPDWSFPSKIKTWSKDGKGGKTVRYFFDYKDPELYLDKKYLECLSSSERIALLGSLVHELAHYNQSYPDFTVDKFRERFSGGAFSNAQDQSEQIIFVDSFDKARDFFKAGSTDCECLN